MLPCYEYYFGNFIFALIAWKFSRNRLNLNVNFVFSGMKVLWQCPRVKRQSWPLNLNGATARKETLMQGILWSLFYSGNFRGKKSGTIGNLIALTMGILARLRPARQNANHGSTQLTWYATKAYQKGTIRYKQCIFLHEFFLVHGLTSVNAESGTGRYAKTFSSHLAWDKNSCL